MHSASFPSSVGNNSVIGDWYDTPFGDKVCDDSIEISDEEGNSPHSAKVKQNDSKVSGLKNGKMLHIMSIFTTSLLATVCTIL